MNNKLNFLNDLFDHMYWADSKVWNVILENLSKIGKDDKIKRLLYHIHMVQFAFLKIWQDEKTTYPKIEEFNNLNEISKWGSEVHNSIIKYLLKFDPDVLEQTAQIPWSDYVTKRFGRKPDDVKKFDTMLQVIMHSTYHRAQVNIRLREFDCAPPPVDYIVWLWSGKPKSESTKYKNINE